MNAKNTQKIISIVGLMQIVALLTSILSITTAFSDGHRIVELFSHFKIQYFALSLFCTILFLMFRHYKTALAMALIAGLNSIYILPWYFETEKDRNTAYTVQLKILHSNVLASNTQYQKLIDLVIKESPDLLILQEVSPTWISNLLPLDNIYSYKHAIPRNDNFGIAIYSKYPFNKITEENWGPTRIPSLNISLAISGQTISLISTHPLPPINNDFFTSRNKQLNDIARIASNIKTPLILIGDLNITMWSKNYVDFEMASGLSNARKGFGLIPTWPTPMLPFMIPIDHCLVSPEFEVQSLKAGPDIGSDHLPLIVKMGLKSKTISKSN